MGTVEGPETTLRETLLMFQVEKLGFKQSPKLLEKVTLKDEKKNLGVNGTGQRKNITSLVTPLPSLILRNNSVPMKVNNTEDDDSDVLPSLPSDIDTESGEKQFNQTLAHHNITKAKKGRPQVLQYLLFHGPRHWSPLLDRHGQSNGRQSKRALTVKLSFDFPFYGHLIKNVTIATGGFLYTGDYVHSWLAATQYIAPLMANFDTSLSNNSFIKYVDNGTAFTVEWQKVTLQEKPEEGEFTFQATLNKNGDIVFVYQSLPKSVKDIQDYNHPVKVVVRRKTIFEYDRLDVSGHNVRNWSAVYLTALPTCLDSHDCTTCLTRTVVSAKCIWCPTLNICSSGFDRHRQDWTAQDCDKKGLSNETMCAQLDRSNNVSFDTNYIDNRLDSSKASQVYANRSMKKQQDDVGISGIVAIMFLVAMVSGLAVWVFYAYRNPHTTSGQILIRYRPSQWRWRRGEARYTAATIHM
ncbi:hypothetical protein NQ318_001373 [Aromia moschata]|uniref:Plexin domain-containing protein 2 n=1 Tax=Aromia moschata TaxID=1265417 RepID=A0AAV8YU49_9CUCU|nr:hypothetical protein NQ318_001373 [Aromia moschata]